MYLKMKITQTNRKINACINRKARVSYKPPLDPGGGGGTPENPYLDNFVPSTGTVSVPSPALQPPPTRRPVPVAIPVPLPIPTPPVPTTTRVPGQEEWVDPGGYNAPIAAYTRQTQVPEHARATAVPIHPNLMYHMPRRHAADPSGSPPPSFNRGVHITGQPLLAAAELAQIREDVSQMHSQSDEAGPSVPVVIQPVPSQQTALQQLRAQPYYYGVPERLPADTSRRTVDRVRKGGFTYKSIWTPGNNTAIGQWHLDKRYPNPN